MTALLNLECKQIGPETNQGKAQGHSGTEGNEDAGERANQKIFRKVPALFEFVGTDHSLRSHQECQGSIASRRNYNREDNSFQVADQAATIVFLDIDSLGQSFLGC